MGCGPRTSERPAQNEQVGGVGAPCHPGKQLPHSGPGQEERRAERPGTMAMSARLQRGRGADEGRYNASLMDKWWRLRRLGTVVWLQSLGSAYQVSPTQAPERPEVP